MVAYLKIPQNELTEKLLEWVFKVARYREIHYVPHMETQYYKDDYFSPNWSIDSMQSHSKPKQVVWRTWQVDSKIYRRVKGQEQSKYSDKNQVRIYQVLFKALVISMTLALRSA